MPEQFALPILGLGAEDTPPTTYVWKDGTTFCRGILGSPETYEATTPDMAPANNVVSLAEYREKKKWLDAPL